MNNEDRITAWNESDEAAFIDYMSSDELRFIEPGQTKKRRLRDSEKVTRLEGYIKSCQSRVWPDNVSEARMTAIAASVLKRLSA